VTLRRNALSFILTVGGLSALRGVPTVDAQPFPPVRPSPVPRAAAGRPTSLQYVSTTGLDSNDGLSWETAKLTIKAAVDALPGSAFFGGTVYFESGVWAQADHSKGLWFTQTSPTPAGWIHAKPLHLIGVAAVDGGLSPAAPTAILNGGPIPFKFINSAQQMLFENVYVDDVQTAVRMNVDDNGNRVLSQDSSIQVVNKRFLNCHLRVSSLPGSGPVVDMGSLAYWNWFDHCVLAANESEPMASDKRCTVLMDGGSSATPGLVSIHDCNMAGGGGVRVRTSPRGGINFDVQRVLLEASTGGVEPGTAQPVVDVVSGGVGEAVYGGAIISNVSIADNSVTAVTVRIDPSIPPGVVTCIQAGVVQGPATVISEGPIGGGPPHDPRQVGISGDRLIGPHDAARRLFGPVSVRFPNLCSQDPARWATSPGGATVTLSIDAPDGSKNAARFESGSHNERQVYRASPVVATGGTLIAGVWARSQGNQTQTIPGVMILSFNGGGVFTSGKINYIEATNRYADQTWEWIVIQGKIASVSGAPEVIVGLRCDSGRPMDFFAPVLCYIPPNTLSDSEVGEFANHMQTWRDGAPVGSLSLLRGQKVSMAPVDQPILASGAGHTADDVILALQALGFVRQA
jgi:hypothetical protein